MDFGPSTVVLSSSAKKPSSKPWQLKFISSKFQHSSSQQHMHKLPALRIIALNKDKLKYQTHKCRHVHTHTDVQREGNGGWEIAWITRCSMDKSSHRLHRLAAALKRVFSSGNRT